MGKGLVRDMTEGKPMKLILGFAVPMFVGNVFQQFYGMVDAIVVGKFVSQNALAAVGATGPLNYFVFAFVIGLATGVSIVVSQLFGAKDYVSVKKSIATGTYIVIGTSIIMGIVGVLASRWLLELLRTPETIINMSVVYMRITFAGIIGMAVYNGIAFILRALGDVFTPLIFLIISSILNVVLDLLFVITFHWGVAGVAIATIIAQAVSAVACILYASKKIELLRFTREEMSPDRENFRRCIKIGIPIALQNSFLSVSTMALQGIINSYGEVVIAAATIVSRIEQFVFEPGCSVGIALSAYTGQNIGAKQMNRVKQGFFAATKIILIFSLIMLPLVYLFGDEVIQLFVKEQESTVVTIAYEGIKVTSIFYILVGMIFVTRNFLSGAGETRIPMLMSFTEVICRVVITGVLSMQYGYYGIWWATGVNWFITSLVGIIWVALGKWKNKSIV